MDLFKMGAVTLGLLAAAGLYGGIQGTIAVAKGVAVVASMVSPPVAVAVGALILYKVVY